MASVSTVLSSSPQQESPEFRKVCTTAHLSPQKETLHKSQNFKGPQASFSWAPTWWV